MKAKSTASKGQKGNYLQLTFCRVPKKNHDALIRNGKKNDKLWLKLGTLKTECFQLGSTEIPGCDSLGKTLSAAEDEEIWVLLQFFKNEKHWGEVMAKMMEEPSVGPMVKEFENLTRGTRLITGGLVRLPV